MNLMTRRDALKGTLATAAALAMPAASAQPAPTPPAAAPPGPFTLAPLPYSVDALEPHIDARTMEIHHGKHHAAYVANLNKAVASEPKCAGKTIEDLVRGLGDIPVAIRTAVRNNGGGHLNHTWFWQMMSKNGGGEPKGELKTSMDKAFGTFDGFKEAFTKAALGQFGSGWAWLCWDPATKGLTIQATANQDSPLMGSSAGTEGTPSEVLRKRYGIKEATHIPLLGLDVWEHAYYLKYQNRRADYVAAFYHVINWDFVSERFATATKA